MTPQTPDTSVTDPAPDPAEAGPVSAATAAPDAMRHPADPPIVDFSRAAGRLRRSAILLGSMALAGWLVTGLVRGSPDVSDLGAWGGLALLGMFVVEVVVVGGSALRGMVNAGDRGERLASGDVGLLPPQVSRGRRSRADEGTGR